MKLPKVLSRLVAVRHGWRSAADHGFGYSRDLDQPCYAAVPAWVEGHRLGRRAVTW